METQKGRGTHYNTESSALLKMFMLKDSFCSFLVVVVVVNQTHHVTESYLTAESSVFSELLPDKRGFLSVFSG